MSADAMDVDPSSAAAGYWPSAWRRFRTNRLAISGLLALAAVAVFCLAIPWFSPYDYDQQDLALGASPPSAAHWLGADVLGRDLLVRLAHGGRLSLLVGVCATAV